MAEFELIQRYCQHIGVDHPQTRLGVGDDAAVVEVPSGYELAVSVDTMVEGVHFPTDHAPDLLARKLLAVNLSDMAAMGAIPKWATLAVSLPTINNDWLASFSQSLSKIAVETGVQLIGGDTTQGSLTLSLTMMGILPIAKRLTRSGAQPGDDVYVSNTLGDAALGLLQQNGKFSFDCQAMEERVVRALYQPIAQNSLGQALLSVATACIDISDGLVGDLAHIAEQSKVSININCEQLPLSEAYQYYQRKGGDLELALTGGDDYQLAFTAPPESRRQIVQLGKDTGVTISRIGSVETASEKPVCLFCDGKTFEITQIAYQHFH